MRSRNPLPLLLLVLGACGEMPDASGPRTALALPTSDTLPPVFTAWTPAADGRLAIVLAADQASYGAQQPIVLRCRVRNDSPQALRILRPFGDPFSAAAHGLQIHGPHGLLAYAGPMKAHVLGDNAFTVLQPGAVCEDRLELPREHFPDLRPGAAYRIAYVYGVSAELSGGPLWTGQLVTAELTILLLP